MKRLAPSLLLLLLATPVTASELSHRVAPDETLGVIAQAYYGNVSRAEIIQIYNGLDQPVIRAGTDLRIPVAAEHKVRVGDSWSALALRYWGDASLHQRLAEQCTGSPDTRLHVGETLRIPVLIPYPLAPGENLARVSRRFYGDSTHAKELARFNRVKHPRRLQVGQKILVPLADLTPLDAGAVVTPEEPLGPAVSSAPPEQAPSSFEKPMRRAINTYLDGRYDQALAQLEELRPQVLARGDQDEQVVLLEYLVFVYTAFDRTDSACDGFRALRQLEPQLRWDRNEISPKILDLVAGCEGG